MKICISFTEAERKQAAAVVGAVRALFRFRLKETPPKDNYSHIYLTVWEEVDTCRK